MPGFHIARRIGRGGMGEVLEAVRIGPGGFRMPVALKRLSADDAIRGEAVQRFFAEARILARMDHPNVVRVYDVLAVDAGYFIVMELLRGATLAELAAAQRGDGGPPWPEILAIAEQALAGLAYAHAARGDDGHPLGLVHRDVTPRNLFVTDAGRVKVLDFGIAKLHERLEAPITREGTVHGTLELLSPEQAAGECADASTDVYQLGATLYWSLAGLYPHGSGSAPELLARIVRGAPRPLAELRPDLPAVVVELIERAMARDRADRFGSAEAMRAAIGGITGAGEVDLTGSVARVLAAGAAAGRASTLSMSAPSRPTSTASLGATHGEDSVAGIDPPATRIAGADGVPGVEGVPGTDGVPGADVPVAHGIPGAARAPGSRRLFARASFLAAAATAVAALAAARLWPGRGGDGALAAAPGREVREVMLTVTGGGEQPMFGGLSRDGRRIVYATGTAIAVKPLTGGRGQSLALPAGFQPVDAEFGWPETRVAAYGQNRSGEWQAWQLGGAAPVLLHTSPDRFMARLSPDGTSLACAHDEREIHLVVAGRPPRTLADLGDGDTIGGMAWSPDGTRLAIVRTAPDGGDDRIAILDVAPEVGPRAAEHTALSVRRPSPTYTGVLLTWPDRRHLLYAVNDHSGASLYSVDLASGATSLRQRWAGHTITGGRWAGGRLLYNRGMHTYGIYLAERGGAPRRLPSGDGRTRRLAGWTPEGSLLYANDAAGNLDVVAHRPDSSPVLWLGGDADDLPDTLVDGAVLFHRREGAVLEVWRSARLGDARHLASVPSAGASAVPVRCAGDRRPPCVLERLDGGAVRFAFFDPTTGSLGREIAAIPARYYYQRNMAVSPDGSALAVVQGGRSITLIDVASGSRRDLPVVGVGDLQSISWSADGRELLVTGVAWRGYPFAALRVPVDGSDVRPIDAGFSRWYWRPQESADGRLVALVGVESATDLAMLEGL